MFTPHKVAGGPSPDAVMVTKRTTRGRYLGTGEEFVIEDDYANPVDAHRVLANAWVGTTQVFEEKIEKMNGNVNEFKARCRSTSGDWYAEQLERRSG